MTKTQENLQPTNPQVQWEEEYESQKRKHLEYKPTVPSMVYTGEGETYKNPNATKRNKAVLLPNQAGNQEG